MSVLLVEYGTWNAPVTKSRQVLKELSNGCTMILCQLFDTEGGSCDVAFIGKPPETAQQWPKRTRDLPYGFIEATVPIYWGRHLPEETVK